MAELIEYRNQLFASVRDGLILPIGAAATTDQVVVAFHAMMFDGVYDADREAHDAVKASDEVAESALPEFDIHVTSPLRQAGIQAECLRSLARVDQINDSPDGDVFITEEDIYAETILPLGYSHLLDFRFAWGDDIEARLDPGSACVQDLLEGKARGISKRSFWLVLVDSEAAFIYTSDYDNNRQGHGSLHTNLFVPPFDSDQEQDLLHYVTDVHGVFTDPTVSFDIETAYSMAPAEYHRI